MAVKLELNLDSAESLSSILLCKCLKVKIYRSIILHRCETWFRLLSMGRRLRVFERRFLKRIFGFKRDVVAGKWRRLHNKKLNDLNSSPDIFRVTESRRLRWAGHVARLGERRGAHRVLVWIPVGNRTLRRPRRRWEDNIKMYLQCVVWGAWSGLIWLGIGTGGWRLYCSNELSCSIKSGECPD